MTDIFREVDEELRQERVQGFLKSYGAYIVAAFVAVVGVVAGVQFYGAWKQGAAGTSGEQFTTAIRLIDDGKYAEAEPVLAELAKDGAGAYPTLARLQEAAALAAAGKSAEAVALYDAISGDGSVASEFRDLASLRAALLLVDSAAPEEIANRIGDLASNDNIWRHTAREALALSHYRVEDYERADEIFDEIMADPAAPARLKSRAEIVRTLIAPKLGGVGG